MDAISQDMRCHATERIHGWRAGWRMLQFIDPDEEATFVTKEFVASRDGIILLHIVAILTSGFMSKMFHLLPEILISQLGVAGWIVQLLVRLVLTRFDQTQAAAIFGWASFSITISQWLCIILVERTTGFAVIDSDRAILPVLTLIGFILQGLIVTSANGHSTPVSVFQSITFTALCGGHLHMHVPQTDRDLMTEREFFCVFELLVVFCYSLTFMQLRSKRRYVAQINRITEQLVQ